MTTATPHEIILRPVVTEKTLRMAERENAYTFKVARDANKVQIRQAIESLFTVRVEAVRTANFIGKYRRVGRYFGRTPNWKKAVVRVKEGDSIKFY